MQAVQKAVADERPDIILLDWELPDGSVEALRALIKATPAATVVILGNYPLTVSIRYGRLLVKE